MQNEPHKHSPEDIENFIEDVPEQFRDGVTPEGELANPPINLIGRLQWGLFGAAVIGSIVGIVMFFAPGDPQARITATGIAFVFGFAVGLLPSIILGIGFLRGPEE